MCQLEIEENIKTTIPSPLEESIKVHSAISLWCDTPINREGWGVYIYRPHPSLLFACSCCCGHVISMFPLCISSKYQHQYMMCFIAVKICRRAVKLPQTAPRIENVLKYSCFPAVTGSDIFSSTCDLKHLTLSLVYVFHSH